MWKKMTRQQKSDKAAAHANSATAVDPPLANRLSFTNPLSFTTNTRRTPPLELATPTALPLIFRRRVPFATPLQPQRIPSTHLHPTLLSTPNTTLVSSTGFTRPAVEVLPHSLTLQKLFGTARQPFLRLQCPGISATISAACSRWLLAPAARAKGSASAHLAGTCPLPPLYSSYPYPYPD